VESDILQPLPRGEGLIRYVDDREFVRLVLSRKKLERVVTHGQAGDRIRDLRTGEIYELVGHPGRSDHVRRAASRGDL
jgi:hypothetical protein